MKKTLYAEAVRDGLEFAMAADDRVYVMGLGAPDPKAIFGTTAGLQERFGAERVLDMPVAENGMTGVAIGSALVGMRPVMIHQRIDFALLALDQIANSAAKWNFMFAGKRSVPLVIRLLIGRGWGQGPQHSQSLQATFAHFPGLKVVMPSTPYDAKGMLISAVEDQNPVIFIEHRWLHNTFGMVPEDGYRVPLNTAAVTRKGNDITIVGSSFAHIDALRAAEALAQLGIDAEVIDLRSIQPIDVDTIASSVVKTRRILVVDHGWKTLGVAGEVIAAVSELCFDVLTCRPRRITAPDSYTSTTPVHANLFYPGAQTIVQEVLQMLGRDALPDEGLQALVPRHRDVPDASFRGPF